MSPHLPRFELSIRKTRLLWALALFGAGVFILGLILAPGRIWANFLLADFYIISLGLSGTFFIALIYVSNAGWATVIRRVPEAMSSTLPVAAMLMLALIFGIHSLYEWSHESAVADLGSKLVWLNPPFFVARMLLYLALWVGLSWVIVRRSILQDSDGEISHTRMNSRNSALFIVVFALTFSFASFDWIMSLQPHWYSTIFALYTFSGLFLNGIAVITLLVIILRRWGVFQGLVTKDHLHDLGKLLFAFSAFWFYLWYSQHMLIWYTNIPEETAFYRLRHMDTWGYLSIINVILNWLLPFLLLLSRSNKRNEPILMGVALIVMLGHWLDLYLMIMPPVIGSQPLIGLWEIGLIVGALAMFFRLFFRAFGRAEMIPVKDPFLEESLKYHA